MAAPASESSGELWRIVGWINRREWQTVFHKIYSDDISHQQHALDRIGAWKSRFGEQMPVSIECTASLVRAHIMDKEGSQADAVQMAYSIAIIRFVNLITGREQKGAVSKSVAFLAEKVGLPSWMVDLRHQAAHRVLPSLTILRDGASRALTWLQKEYWEAQSKKGHLEEEPVGCSADSDTKEAVSECVIQYQQEQFENLKPVKKKNNKKRKNSKESTQNTTESQRQSLTAESNEALVDLEELLTTNQNARHIMSSILILDGYLVPTDVQLSSLHVNKGYQTNSNHVPILDRKIISFWTPLLQLLHSLNITPLLLAALLKELARFTLPGNEIADYLMGWVVLIATAAGKGYQPLTTSGTKRGRSPERSEISDKKPLYEGCRANKLPWNDLVTICIENPNIYTLTILAKILKFMSPKPTQETVNKIRGLCILFTKPYANMVEALRRSKKVGKKCRKTSADDTEGSSWFTAIDDENGEENDEEIDTIESSEEKNEETQTGDKSETPADLGLETLPADNNVKTIYDNGQDKMELETPLDANVETPVDASVETHSSLEPERHSPVRTEQSDVNGAALIPVHSVNEIVSLLKKKRETVEGFIGISSKSAEDARLLRKRGNTDWTKSSDIKWADYPLGMLPGQPTDPDYLLLNIHESKKQKRSCDEHGGDKSGTTMTSDIFRGQHSNSERRNNTPSRKLNDHVDSGSGLIEETHTSSSVKVMSKIDRKGISMDGDSHESYDIMEMADGGDGSNCYEGEVARGQNGTELMGANQVVGEASRITLF